MSGTKKAHVSRPGFPNCFPRYNDILIYCSQYSIWHSTNQSALANSPEISTHQTIYNYFIYCNSNQLSNQAPWELQNMFNKKNYLYLVGGLEHFLFFPSYWEFHNPNWLINMFQMGRSTTNQYIICTLCLFNIAMENGPCIDDFPIKTSIYEGFSMAMLNNQMV